LKIHLVRHARAVAREEWNGEDLLRPLSERGWRDAEALARQLADEPLARIVCGPTLRCQQTVEPLAVARDLPVEVDERLGRDEAVSRALELLPGADDGPVLFCSHAEVIVPILQAFELCDPEPGARIPCRKGSLWTLDGAGFGPTRADYLEPVAPKRGDPRYALRETPRPRSVRAAVLDLGSTSFALLIGDVRGGEIRPVVSEKVMLRLGALVARGGAIPADAFAHAIEVARELHAVAVQEKAERFSAVATAAARDAGNGRALAAAISEALGEPVRILSGEEEARAIFRAFQHRLALGDEPVLGLDLGGGSLELAAGSRRGLVAEVTLPLGVVRLREELVRRDPMGAGDLRRIRERVLAELAPVRDALLRNRPTELIATGGTARALAHLVEERAPRPAAGVRLRIDALRELGKQLARSSHEERLRMRGIRRRRADLLPTGAAVLETVLDALGADSVVVCDWGLREGIMLDALSRR
jgi:exopolyphosphatase/guanosine-5'-triphosphate,3'-diphosphate pyrophosphatase